MTALFQAMTSQAMELGAFARVNGHEPNSAPGVQISFSLWLASIRPVATSGLNAVSGVVTFTGRVYKAATRREPDRARRDRPGDPDRDRRS